MKIRIPEKVKFILFLTFIGVVYISNSYIYRGKLRELKVVQDSLQTVKLEYLYVLSRYANATRAGVVESLLVSRGSNLREIPEPPYIIEIKGNYLNKIKRSGTEE